MADPQRRGAHGRPADELREGSWRLADDGTWMFVRADAAPHVPGTPHQDQHGNVIDQYHVCGCRPSSAPQALDVTDEDAIRRRLLTDPVASYFFELGRGAAIRDVQRRENTER